MKTGNKGALGLAFFLQEVVYYLVKWCSLPYEDSTWELKDDVDQSKIEEFEQLQAVKPDSRRVVSHVPLALLHRFPQACDYPPPPFLCRCSFEALIRTFLHCRFLFLFLYFFF